ncbi:MAG: hypothetical protein DRQ55_17860, partial [Planctomycetota bacterium]
MRRLAPSRCASRRVPLPASLGLCALLFGAPALCASSAQDVLEQSAPTDTALEQARAALLDASVEELELSLHAKTLLDAGDVQTLGSLLSPTSDERVARAIVATLNNARHAGFMDELLGLSAGAHDASLRRSASDGVRRMACSDPAARDALVADLRAAERPLPERRAIVAVLGACRDLSVVEPLLEQLEGELSMDAHEALFMLTGFDPHPRGGVQAWRRVWERHGMRSREELLELALVRTRSQMSSDRAEYMTSLSALRVEVEQAHIDRMGSSDVGKLVAGLADEYPRVRQTAALRLAQHPSPDQAASALPALLLQLGVPTSDGSNGDHVAVEQDPVVRAALVTAVGELGRNLPEALSVLIVELASPHAEVSGAALSALGKVRGQPQVVRPLLALLERSPDDAETLVLGLSIIAANRPQGVLADLERHLSMAPSTAVQAEAVRALLACDQLESALALVAGLAAPSTELDVRFALARALGDRSREPDLAPELRAQMVDLLASLSADPEPPVRAEAVSSLGESGAPEALPELEARAPVEADPTVLLRVVRALGELGNPDAIRTIGRLSAERDSADPLWAESRAALLALGASMSTAEWWAVAQTLREVRADELALVAVQQIVSPSQPTASVDRQLVPQALGLRAELLAQVGQWQEAYELLLVLHESEAAWPAVELRLTLLAECAEQLERPGAAAEHFAALHAHLPKGDGRRTGVQRRLAEALWKADLKPAAVLEIQQLYDAKPEDNELMFWLAQVRMDLGEDAVARELLLRLAARVPSESTELRERVAT